MQRRSTFTAVFPFLLLFALLYSAFGASSPFLPALMEARGIPVEQIGIIFGAATAIRLISAPIAGRIADRTQALRTTLAACTIAMALAALGYLSASGFWTLLVVSLLHALALGPTTNLADALAVVAAKREGFEYGWARGAGSAAFIWFHRGWPHGLGVRDLDRCHPGSHDAVRCAIRVSARSTGHGFQTSD
jgi:MFS transporter, PPP family, 3-phenylpropionic acid transporter